MGPAALIPIKRFVDAKQRLAPALGAGTRRELAMILAAGVVDAVRDLPAFVACDDEEVAAWATDLGLGVVWTPGLGLNGAVDAGVAAVAAAGHDHVVVAHSDLVAPQSLATVARAGWVTLVPDRRDDGTNAMGIPLTGDPFPAAYGPGSFRRHLALAVAARHRIEVRRDPLLALDVDTPVDLAHPTVAALLARTSERQPVTARGGTSR